MRSTPFSALRVSLIVSGAAVCLLAGCATNQKTTPLPIALVGKGYNDKILAILPVGEMNPLYGVFKSDQNRSWWMPRLLYGKGEVTVLSNAYAETATVIYNRLRGYNGFRRVVIVSSRKEADDLRANFLLCFHINDMFAVGRGANWNCVEWSTFEGIASMDVIVYDLDKNERISHQVIQVNAFDTEPWSTPDVRDFVRWELLSGVTLHNAIAQIDF